MLQTIREKSQGWIATVILGIVCFSFALWGIHYYLTQSPGTTIVAKVNGAKITEKTFNSVYHQIQQQAEVALAGNYSNTPELQQQLKKQALDEIINSEILAQALKKQGFYIGIEQLDQILTQIPAFQENGQFSSARYQQALASMSYTPQQFFEKLSQQLMVSQAHKGIVSSGFSLPDDVRQALRLMLQTRDIGYVIFKRAEMKPATPVTEQDVKNYYDSHQKQFTIPEKIILDYIVLSANELAQQKTVSDKAIAQYYQNNQAQFSEPTKWQVIRVVMPLDNSVTPTQETNAKMNLMSIKPGFTKANDINSQAEGINANVMPETWLVESQISPLEVKTLQTLKPGMVSDPIRIGDQLEMIKLIAVKPGQTQQLPAVKAKIANILKQQQVEKDYASLSDNLANLAYENPNSLQAVSNQLGLPVKTSVAFAKHDKNLSGILANRKVVDAAFSADVYQQGYNSDVINVSPAEQVVIRVKQKIPAEQIPFAQVQDKIKTLLTAKAQEQATKELATQVANALATGVPGSEVAKKFNVTWHEKADVDRHQQHVDPKVLETIFDLQAPIDRAHPTTAALALPKGGDYVAVAIYQVTPGDPNKMNKIQKEAFFEVIGNKYGNADFQLYLESLRDKAKIKIYKDALASN